MGPRGYLVRIYDLEFCYLSFCLRHAHLFAGFTGANIAIYSIALSRMLAP